MGVVCPKCGHQRTQTDGGSEFECPKCGIIYAKFDLARHEQRQRELRSVSMCLTTADCVPGHSVVQVIDLVSGECAYGINVLKDVLAAAVDLTGGRSGVVQATLRKARTMAMQELKREAADLGADAVIGVRFSFNEYSGEGKSMLFVVVTGTAVRTVPLAAGGG